MLICIENMYVLNTEDVLIAKVKDVLCALLEGHPLEPGLPLLRARLRAGGRLRACPARRRGLQKLRPQEKFSYFAIFLPRNNSYTCTLSEARGTVFGRPLAVLVSHIVRDEKVHWPRSDAQGLGGFKLSNISLSEKPRNGGTRCTSQ